MDNVTIFSEIGKIIENLMSLLRGMSLNDKFVTLQSLLGIVITINIMYKGYMVLAGRTQDPIRELIWDIARKLFILGFVLNAGGWLDSSIGAIEGFYSWAGGGDLMYTKLDTLSQSVLNNIETFYDNADGFTETLISIFVIVALIFCFIAITFEIFFTIIATSVTNTFLIVALPLALICFMFQQTKNVFTQWLQLFISNLFLLIFLGAFLGFFANHIVAIFDLRAITSENTSVIQVVVQVILFSFILIQVCKVIKDLAKNLAQVTLDSAVSGVGAANMAGRGARATGGGITSLGRSFANKFGGVGKGGNSSEGGAGGAIGELAGAAAKGGKVGLAVKAASMASKAIISKMRNK